MNYKLLEQNVMEDITSTEEGRNELVDYARGKTNDTKKLLRKYSDIFFERTGQRIDFYDRYLSERERKLLEKEIPNIYSKWKNDGIDSIPGIQDLTKTVLRCYKEWDGKTIVQNGNISDRIRGENEQMGLNEHTSVLMSVKIIDIIENARYYTAKILGMDIRSKRVIEEFLSEFQQLIDDVKIEEIREILNRVEIQILQKVDESVDISIGLGEQEENKACNRDKLEFRDSMLFNVDYSKIVEKYSRIDEQGNRGKANNEYFK